MRPTESTQKAEADSPQPMKKNTMPNRVNTPSASDPTRMRRTMRYTKKRADSSDTAMPTMEKSCSGTTEKPVIKSKFRRIKLYMEYFERPAKRSSWVMGTSMGRMAYRDAKAGMKVLTSRVWLSAVTTDRA